MALNKPSKKMELRILQLIDQHPNQTLRLSLLREVYFNRFGEDFDKLYKQLGYKKLTIMIESFPSLTIKRGTTAGVVSICRSSSDRTVPTTGNIKKSADTDKVPVQPDDNSTSNSKLLSNKVMELRILQLIDQSSNHEIQLSMLRNIYRDYFREDFNILYEQLGCNKLTKMIESFPSLTTKQGGPKNSNLFIYRVQSSGRPTSVREKDETIPSQVEVHKPPYPFDDNVVYIGKLQQLQDLGESDERFNSNRKLIDNLTIAVTCISAPEHLYLIQVALQNVVYVFDCLKLGAEIVCHFLKELLLDTTVTKLFHDVHKDAVALAKHGGIVEILGVLDTQLAMEFMTGQLQTDFNDMLKKLGQPQQGRMKDSDIFARRPIPPDVLHYAVNGVRLLLDSKSCLFEALGDSVEIIQKASDVRARAALGGSRFIAFDVANSYSMVSFELIHATRPQDMLIPTPLRVSNEIERLLSLLKADLKESLEGQTDKLSDIVLDKGRRPLAWVAGERVLLGKEDRLVDAIELNDIVNEVGGFGSDNRAGLEQQLHRISAIRNRESKIIGVTMRVGRHISGNAHMISDLLFSYSSASILFVGEPGSGKTTVVREVCRLLAERSNVCIVDTSNEIAGDGDIPHHCVGYARRMMVPSLDQQSAVMIECVQNHTPEIMIIDEIGRPTEVEAARTCKNRGVRLIASAHGDLRKLVKNPKLRGLIGGIENVTLGDAQAKLESKNSGTSMQKLKAQRAGPPTFEIIVELRRSEHHEWRIILNVANAVDEILEGRAYKAQRRIRNKDTGAVELGFEMG